MIYEAIRESKDAVLKNNIDNLTVLVEVENPGFIPVGPAILTIGNENTESIYYTGIVGNTLQGVIRGYRGSTASNWDAGSSVRRTLTSIEWNNLIEHIYNSAEFDTDITYNTDGYVKRIIKMDFQGNKLLESFYSYDNGLLVEEDVVIGDKEGTILYELSKMYRYNTDGTLDSVTQEVL